MDTSSGTNPPPVHEFIQQQGGHQFIGQATNAHTQTFITTDRLTSSIEVGSQSDTHQLTFCLSNLLPRLNLASLWQTYKVNFIEASFYFHELRGEVTPASVPNVLLSVAPYSRDSRTGLATRQDIDPRSLPGCESKVFQAVVVTQLGSEGQVVKVQSTAGQAQMLKVQNGNPLYAINSVPGADVTNGEVYSAGKLSLVSGAGIDTTAWYTFIANIDMFQINNGSFNIDHVWDIVYKIGITFEGLRWVTEPLLLQLQGDSLGPDNTRKRLREFKEAVGSAAKLQKIRDFKKRDADNNEQLRTPPHLHMLPPSSQTEYIWDSTAQVLDPTNKDNGQDTKP